MFFRRLVFRISLLCLPIYSMAQVDLFAVTTSTTPDFGATNGTWGHLQFYRPFGIKGVELQDFRDLTGISPLTGEPLNTDRQGWIPIMKNASLWDQMHPDLTAPADTIAPSTLVNYRQGDGIFKDFTLWYHNSLDKNTRYGWTSKLRSHPRLAEVTVHKEQRHRFQANTVSEDRFFQVEAGYTHRINPLYTLAQDSALNWYYDDDPQIHSKRWDGSVAWNNLDSSAIGTEIFAWVQGGIWSWQGEERNSLYSIAFADHSFSMLGLGTASVQLGVISKQFGGTSRTQQFAEFTLPSWSGKHYQVELGVRNLGQTPMFPKVKVQSNLGVLKIDYQTHQVIEERLWYSKISVAQLHEVTAGLNFTHARLALRGWTGKDEGNPVSGYAGEGQVHLPWKMSVMLGGAVLQQASDWVFSEKYLNWEINQELTLFKNALYADLKIWGKHMPDTRLGLLDIENFEVSNSNYTGDELLHILNYTISGQVGTVLVSFTDQNTLHDGLWSQYADIPWEPQFSIMANQVSNSRFRYVSIIWTFDN